MILTFFLLSLLVLFLDQWTDGWTTMHLFCVYRSSLKDPLFYIRLFGHVLGHASWDHFLNNMLLLLVCWPANGRKVRQQAALCGMVFTALVTGVLQCVLFPRSGLLGASGIVFMLIMLSSLAGFSGGIRSPCCGCSAVLWSAGVRYHFCARQCSKLHAHCGRLMRHCLWLLQCVAQPPQADKAVKFSSTNSRRKR
ncbi:MAG: rhomboid family intramembrane serine protease [Hydrogeniiclostridium mannosilyticum]